MGFKPGNLPAVHQNHNSHQNNNNDDDNNSINKFCAVMCHIKLTSEFSAAMQQCMSHGLKVK
jgi:hypothetical protein